MDLIHTSELIERELRVFRSAMRLRLENRHRGLPPEVAKALAHLDRHLFDATLTVGSLRRAVGLSSHSLSARFRLHLGLGLREYIEAQRLRAAERLLRHPEIPIYLVAYSVGYEVPDSFARAFRRHHGVSPSGFRADLLESQESGARQ